MQDKYCGSSSDYRAEYGQALAFDQLRNVMQESQAFVGFNEAEIDFPPTFKYDVLRYKRSKHRSVKRVSKHPDGEIQIHGKQLTEVEEALPSAPLDEDRSEGEQEYDGEAASLASTAWTGQSKYTEGDDGEDDYFYGRTSPRLPHTVGNLINKSAASAAVQKAKVKWMSLINPDTPSPSTPFFKRLKNKHRRQDNGESWRPDSPPPSFPSPPLTASMPNSPPPEFRSLTFPPTPVQDNIGGKELPNDKLLMPPRSLESSKSSIPLALVTRTASSKSTDKLDQEEEGDEKGVYDTSHKRRVPSWRVNIDT